jgi:hypothetical protein
VIYLSMERLKARVAPAPAARRTTAQETPAAPMQQAAE